MIGLQPRFTQQDTNAEENMENLVKVPNYHKLSDNQSAAHKKREKDALARLCYAIERADIDSEAYKNHLDTLENDEERR